MLPRGGLPVDRVLGGSAKLAMPPDRQCNLPLMHTSPEPNTPTKCTSTSSLTCSPTPSPSANWTKLTLRSPLSWRLQTTPVHSSAESRRSAILALYSVDSRALVLQSDKILKNIPAK